MVRANGRPADFGKSVLSELRLPVDGAVVGAGARQVGVVAEEVKVEGHRIVLTYRVEVPGAMEPSEVHQVAQSIGSLLSKAIKAS